MAGIAGWIDAQAERTPDKIALRFEGEARTYGKLADESGGAARLLVGELRLKPGDRIAWLGLNRPEMLILLLAAARAGLMLVPLNWRLAAPEQAHMLKDAEIAALVIDGAFAARGAELLSKWPCPAFGVGCDALPSLEDAARSSAGPIPDAGQPDAPLLLVYTSGTTGQPKGAVLSQAAIEYNARNAIHMHDMTAHDHVLTVLPMFHVGGLNIQTLPALRSGATVTLHPRFDPGRTLSAIAGDRPTLTVQVPATLQALIAHPDWAATDLSSLRAVTTGSTDVPLPLIRALHGRGVPVIQVYGATETGPVCLYQRIEEAMANEGSIGRSGAHSAIRLADAQGRDVADGTPGEILVGGGTLAQGYWRDPVQSAAAFRDGWFHSGDVAARDIDGRYWFKDRIKNVIISGGENVYPAEIERVLNEMPGIAEAAVVGRPDPRWGETPVAVVVRRDANLDAGTIRAAFEGRLARYKHPRDVVFVDALPRNAMGKVVVEEVTRLIADRER